MKVLIRCDSGHHIGIGHLIRCLNLARELSSGGHEIIFLVRNHVGQRTELLKNQFEYHLLDGGVSSGQSVLTNYSEWLGVPVEKEIEDIQEFVEQYGPFELIVFDHYGIDITVEKHFSSSKLLVIDDLMNRMHCCDYLLDQNPTANEHTYRRLVTKGNCSFFLGLDYAIINKSFLRYRKSTPRVVESVANVLVFFGASDISNETKKVLDACLTVDCKLQVEFILDSSHQDYSYVAEQCSRNPSYVLHEFVDDMAEKIFYCDVFFGASGSSSWERAVLSCPSFVVMIAENQEPIGRFLDEHKVAMVLGSGRDTSSESWVEALSQLDDIELLNDFSENSFRLCNGLGVTALVEGMNLA